MLSSIHFIIYDTKHDPYINFAPSTSAVDLTSSVITYKDDSYFAYTPMFYTYFVKKSKLSYGYETIYNSLTNQSKIKLQLILNNIII